MKRPLASPYSIHRYNSINELPECYNDLFENAAYSFFLTRSWFEIQENTTCPEHDQFFYLTAERNAEPLAVMALRTPAGQLGSSLQEYNVGKASVASLTNWYTCLYDLVLSSLITDMDGVVQALINDLKKRFGQVAVIEFNYLENSSPTIDTLIRALRSAGLITLPYRHNLIRYEDMTNITFDDYLKQRPRGLRKEYYRYGRILEKSYEVKEVIYGDDTQLGKALADFQKIYAKSWKRPERYPQFIPELFRQGLAERLLRVAILYLDGRPVAADIYILFNGQAIIYKGAYDSDYKKQSPATVGQMSAMKHLIDVDGISEINFGYGDESYKKKWLAQSRDLTGILAFNPRSARGWGLLFKYIFRRFIQKLVYIKNNYN